MCRDSDTRFVECSACGGDTVIEHLTRYYDEYGNQMVHSETCPYCSGFGVEEVEVEPITIEDLEDL